MIQDAKTMLKLMGMPIIEAPSEAEATCSALNKAGKVFATATEDLDALTFGTNILLRSFNNKKEPITEVNRDEMLKVILIYVYLYDF
jgi:flap endonuclease-1